ncbi:hypothetical protein DFQ26_006417 [Actinomortierella ambigua]|nr:hypothetical protein DFQ26_006417 [Actinomortierella ambigua]
MSSLIVGSYVGGGSYGRVYNAEWEGRKVAIKKFVLSYDEMDTTLAMKQEIKMLELLVDRHIIQFYGTTHYEGQLVLVMDYAEGGSLEQAILARRTTEWPTKIRIVQETVRGLAYIHHKGVLHRDLKSMNILLTRHMEVKLCDFGLATVKVRSSARSTISFKGTARWMAPELLNTRPKYSNKSDMFALGMVMWELAANCTTPFQHQPDNFPVMNAVMLGEREVLPDDTPSDYRQWVERCWDHDPAKRPEASEMITKDDDPVVESGHGNHGTTVKLLLDASGRILPHSSGESTQELSGGAVGNALLTNANTGDAEAELSLARKYASGNGVERNETEAFKWYLQAAEHGSLEATYKTAEYYRHGFGVEKNEATAVHWMQLAAERGHHIAQNGLGWMLRNGEGVEQNYDKAISWFRRSAEQGFAPAQNNLGWMYQSGSGTQQDYGLAVSWYRKAAEQGDSAAQNNLGAMYKHGHGVDRDYTEAFKWFSKSADGGFSVGLFNLGWLYQMGFGAPKDIQKAIELYRQSAAKGHPNLNISSFIGSGTYGKVNHARWEGQMVAIKKFPLAHDEVSQAPAIQVEIDQLLRLADRHIIQIYGTTYHDDQLVLAMDYAEGGSLRQVIEARQATYWPTKERITQEIVRGLAYLHRMDVLHQDLKSSNVLLTRDMKVKLSDFGLPTVKTHSVAKSASSSQGMNRWMAPELFTASPKYSTKSDIFALGVVMWELAANCTTPFKDWSDRSIMHLTTNGEREVLPGDTPSDYRQWVERCWDYDPTERPEASEMITKDDDPDRENASGGNGSTSSLLRSMSDLSLSSEDSIISSGLVSQSPNDGTDAFLIRSRADDAEAQVELAVKYEKGIDVDQSDSEAFHWYLLAARLGSAEAQYKTGLFLSQGRGTPKDDTVAVYWIRQAVERGHQDAQTELGWMYQNGLGVEQDYGQAVSWYRKSVDGGNASGQKNLGRMYKEGLGVEQDYDLAISLFRQSAEQGNASAQRKLGRMYLDGHGVERDYDQALSWFQKSADQGKVSAYISLGRMYQNGCGVEQDYAQAIAWYRKAADLENPVAYNSLGWMYQNGLGVERDNAQALEWYLKAADQGNSTAQDNLGKMYQHGQGVQQDYGQAMMWFRKSADQGNAPAQKNLGSMYTSGLGVEKDYAQGALWIRKAADQGNASAQKSLGWLHFHGHGVNKDYGLAFSWYRKSAVQENAVAQRHLGRMYRMGCGAKRDFAEALIWFSKSAEHGDSHAQFDLGEMYNRGQGVRRSVKKAIQWYRKAADQGHPSAIKKLRALE